MRAGFAVGMILVCVATLGCGDKFPPTTLTSLNQAESFELLSLNPAHLTEKPENDFHGWEVLGSTKVEDTKDRTKLIAALRKGVNENDGTVAGCFNPRHGIRVTSGGTTTEIVICFECMSAQVYVNGKRQSHFLLTNSPQPTFDAVLKEAGVPLATQADE